jgi:hypothetical protein
MPVISTPPVSSVQMARNIYDPSDAGVVDTVQAFSWLNILGIPKSFNPLPVAQWTKPDGKTPMPLNISDVTGLSTYLSTFVTAGNLNNLLSTVSPSIPVPYYNTTQVNNLLATKAQVIHFHDQRYVQFAPFYAATAGSGIDSTLSVYQEGLAGAGLEHNHDERYYTQTYIDNVLNNTTISLVNDARYYTKPEVDSDIAGCAPLVHNHNNLYYLQSQIDARFAVYMGTGTYVYTPLTAASEWDIDHGLGMFPTVNIVVSGQLSLAKITYPDDNHVTILFASPQIGQAYLT